MYRLARGITAATLLTMASITGATPCVNDIDCPGMLVCIEGQCQETPKTDAPEEEIEESGAEPRQAASDTDESKTDAPQSPGSESQTAPLPSSDPPPTVVETPSPPPEKEETPEATPPPAEPPLPPQSEVPEKGSVEQGEACNNHEDCGESRICVSGKCQAQIESSDAEIAAQLPSQGWSLGGALIGLVSLAPFNALGGLMIYSIGDRTPALAFSVSTLVTLAAAGPVVNLASKSARIAGVRGNVGLRLPAWILWGIAVCDAIAITTITAVDQEVHEAQMALAMGFGSAALLLFSFEALYAKREASEAMARLGINKTKENPTTSSITIQPIVAPYMDHQGIRGGTAGVSGRF